MFLAHDSHVSHDRGYGNLYPLTGSTAILATRLIPFSALLELRGWLGRYSMCQEGRRILRRAEVERITGLPRSTLYEMINRGEFPPPVRLGRRAVGWFEADVLAWLDSRPTAALANWS